MIIIAKANTLYHMKHGLGKITVMLPQIHRSIIPTNNITRRWCTFCPTFMTNPNNKNTRKSVKFDGSAGGCPGNSYQRVPSFNEIKPDYNWCLLPSIKVDIQSSTTPKISGNRGAINRSFNYLSSPFLTRYLNSITTDSTIKLNAGSCFVCRLRGGCKVPETGVCPYPNERVYSMESTTILVDKLYEIVFGEKIYWFTNIIPEYMIRMGLIFLKEPISESEQIRLIETFLIAEKNRFSEVSNIEMITKDISDPISDYSDFYLGIRPCEVK